MTLNGDTSVLEGILRELQALRLKNDQLEAKVRDRRTMPREIGHSVESHLMLAVLPPLPTPTQLDNLTASSSTHNRRYSSSGLTPVTSPNALEPTSPRLGLALSSSIPPISGEIPPPAAAVAPNPIVASIYPQRVILTTHPGQPGIRPLPMEWAAKDWKTRGPVVASRHPNR